MHALESLKIKFCELVIQRAATCQVGQDQAKDKGWIPLISRANLCPCLSCLFPLLTEAHPNPRRMFSIFLLFIVLVDPQPFAFLHTLQTICLLLDIKSSVLFHQN